MNRRLFLWLAGAAAPAAAAVNPRQFGAAGDQQADDTAPVQQSIDKAFAAGGGTVRLTPGRYRCGTLTLKSRVSLHLDNGAALVMSPEDKDFLPPEKLAYNTGADHATSTFRRALIYAEQAEHIAVTGQGLIECGRNKSGGPKPLSFRRCTNVTIRDITLRNAPSYNISLLGCDYVNIDGVTIQSGWSDGIDPDCCRFVRVSNCFVESVNDSFVLKASGALGERRSTEHVSVSNCVLRTASLHLKCGTESCGDFRNITFTGCTLVGDMGGRHGNPGIGLYTVDGGRLEGVSVSNIAMQNVGIPLAILRGNRDRCSFKGEPGALRDVSISNVVAIGAKMTSVIAGIPGFPVEDIRLRDVSIRMGRAGAGPAEGKAVPEKPDGYPDPTMFGPLPSWGLFVRHARRLELDGMRLAGHPGDRRPAIVADDIAALRFNGREYEGPRVTI